MIEIGSYFQSSAPLRTPDPLLCPRKETGERECPEEKTGKRKRAVFSQQTISYQKLIIAKLCISYLGARAMSFARNFTTILARVKMTSGHLWPSPANFAGALRHLQLVVCVSNLRYLRLDFLAGSYFKRLVVDRVVVVLTYVLLLWCSHVS